MRYLKSFILSCYLPFGYAVIFGNTPLVYANEDTAMTGEKQEQLESEGAITDLSSPKSEQKTSLKQPQPEQSTATPTNSVVAKSSSSCPKIDSTETTIFVRQIEFVDIQGKPYRPFLSKEKLEPIIQSLQGCSVTSDKLAEAEEKINQLYLAEGYITSRAFSQGLTDGIVRIGILEGSVEKITIEGSPRLEKYVRSRLERAISKPFKVSQLEEQLRLLKADPLLEKVQASLRTGTHKGQSQLFVDVTAAKPFANSIGVNNYSPPSIGAENFNYNLGYRNLLGFGDTLSSNYNPSFDSIGGTYNLGFDYEIPLNSMNGRLNLRTTINRNKVVSGQFKDLDIEGETELYELAYRQPLVLTPQKEFALSLGFAYQDGQTFTFQGPTPFGFGPDEDGTSRTSVLFLGQEYTRRDVSGAWAFGSQFRLGLDILNATNHSDSTPDGQFLSWLTQAQRVQVLNDDNFLIIQANLQLAPNSLLPSEQFVIGGGQSVRGYRQNARSGDGGFSFSIEDRITLAKNQSGEPSFILAPFFDMGSVWNVDDNPNPIPEQKFIAALGLGFLFQPIPGLNLRLDYAPPLINLDDRGDNIQDNGLHFSTNYNF
jgi:hemolysin activation/secretion protein